MATAEEQFSLSLCKLHKVLAYISIVPSKVRELPIRRHSARMGIYGERDVLRFAYRESLS